MVLPRDRVVLITGASGGIGRATAMAFARDGARVVLAARNCGKLREAEREITSAGGSAHSVPCDVRDHRSVNALIESAVEKFGALHILINNAGIGLYSPVEMLTKESLDEIMETNLYGPIYAVQAALPHLRKTRGQIVNISSILARTTLPYSAAYCMTKHALHALSEALRLELKPQGITVIEVGPGLTATDFQKNSRKRGLSSALADNNAGWPVEKVAQAILKASKSGRREVWLTFGGKAFIRFNYHAPKVLDWALAKWARGLSKLPLL